MIITLLIDRHQELGWTGERLASLMEYEKALLAAKYRNPKYPRDYFLPLDQGETVRLAEGLFRVGKDLELLPISKR